MKLLRKPATFLILALLTFLVAYAWSASTRGGSETQAILASVVREAIWNTGVVVGSVLALVGLVMLWSSTDLSSAYFAAALAAGLLTLSAGFAWVHRAAPCAYRHDRELCGTTPLPQTRVQRDSGGYIYQWDTAHHVVRAERGRNDVAWTVARKNAPEVPPIHLNASQVAATVPSYGWFTTTVISPTADRLALLLLYGAVDLDLRTGRARFVAFDEHTEASEFVSDAGQVVALGPDEFVVPYLHGLLHVNTGASLRVSWLATSNEVRLEEVRTSASSKYACFSARPEDRSSGEGACVIAKRARPKLTFLERARAAFGLLGILFFFVNVLAMAGTLTLMRRFAHRHPPSWEQSLSRLSAVALVEALLAAASLFG